MSLYLHTLDVLSASNPTTRSDALIFGQWPNIPFPVSANAVTGVSVTPGTGYTSLPTLGAASDGNGAVAVATSLKVVSAAAHSGAAGSGYVTNDTITLADGVVLTVTASSGAITALAVATAGSATAAPANPNAIISTSGSGTGATVDLVWGIGTVTVLDSGTGSTGSVTFAVTGGGGTSGAVSATKGGNGNAIYRYIAGALPTTYGVHLSASVPGFLTVDQKSITGFRVGITPETSSSTLAAGTIDAVLFA